MEAGSELLRTIGTLRSTPCLHCSTKAPASRTVTRRSKRPHAGAISCRNADGGFGHFPGSTSDADAVYFQIGTLVMAGVLSPQTPLPNDPQLLSWGHLIPVAQRRCRRITVGFRSPAGLAESLSIPMAVNLRPAAPMASSASGMCKRASCLTRCAVTRTPSCAIAYARTGNWIVTCSHDGTTKIWPDLSGETSRALTGHRGPINSVAVSLDDSLVATAGVDGQVILWDTRSGERRQILLGHKSWVNSIAFTPSGDQILSASSDGTIKVWSAPSGELKMTLPISKAEVRSVAVSSDGKWIAAGIRYGTIKVYSARRLETAPHTADRQRRHQFIDV